MLILSIIMASAGATEPAPLSPSEYRRYCEQSSSGETADKVQKKCIELVKKLVEAEKAAARHRNEASALLVKCDAAAKAINSSGEFSALLTALAEAEDGSWAKSLDSQKGEGKGFAPSCPKAVPGPPSLPPTDGTDELPEVLLARERYEAARAKYDSAEKALEAAEEREKASRDIIDRARTSLAVLHAGEYSEFLQIEEPRQVASIERKMAKGRNGPLLTLSDCDLTRPSAETSLLANANGCEHLAIAWSDPRTRFEGGPEPTRPKRPTLDTSFTAGQAGSNAEVLWSGRISSFSTRFPEGQNIIASRRPRYWSYSVGFEAKAKDGIATVIGGNSDDANFLSRDRLSSTLALKGAVGLNFFARETLEQFEDRRAKLLVDLRKKCAASLGENSTLVATNCGDEKLLAWIYERDGKKFKRPDEIDAYEKLIWNASQKLPQFGFGGNTSFGLRSQDYYRFADADGDFDPSLVEVDPFFGKDKTYSAFGAIENRLTYTVGAYSYWHFPLENADWFDGLTIRLDGTVKYDLQDLDDKETDICRKDLSGIGSDDIFLASDQCRSVIAFEPEFKTTVIPKITFRLATGAAGIFPELGFAPSFSMELREDSKDLKRFDFPVFFTLKDGKLTSGIGVAREWDPAKPKNKNATTVYIFFGKRFSLDGSQE